MCKTNVEMNIYYVNKCKHEHEKNMKGYGVRSCLRLMLNKLKEMKGPTFTYTPLGPSSKKLSKRLLCVHQINKLFENLPK
jgi:hypothetical protein